MVDPSAVRHGSGSRIASSAVPSTARRAGRGTEIDTTIPAPRATERRFWALSAAPSTNAGNRLFCFSINQPETFVLFDIGDDVYGFLTVSRTALSDAYGSLQDFDARYGKWIVVDADAGYEACGGDAVRLLIDGERAWCRVLGEPDFEGIRNAARIMNLNLMRRGPTFQAKGHNVLLADVILDAVLASYPDHDAKTEADGADPTEYSEFTGPLAARPNSESTPAELVDGVAEIVAVEGPVVGTRIHRAFAHASGVTRVGARTRQRLDGALSAGVRQASSSRMRRSENAASLSAHTVCPDSRRSSFER